MKFSELSYERIDIAALKSELQDITDRLRNAESFGDADAAFVAMNDCEGRTLLTQRTIAQIRRDINTKDEFYDGEMTYYNKALPELQPLRKAWTKTLLESPWRKGLEEKYGSVTFLNAEMSLKTFRPELVEDLQKENALVMRYTKLIASAQILFEGESFTLSQLSPFKLDPDDSRRLAAWNAEGAWYNAHGTELDEIYDELVKLRDGMGRKLGYDGYTQLGYYRMSRNCYTTADVDKFRKAVQKYLVPVAEKIYRRQAERVGKEYPLNFADKDLAFRSGNPRPAGTPDDILTQGSKFYSELSPETKEFWDHMTEHEMMDVLSRPGKAAGGYCTCIYDLRSPFIFANFNGTAHDVEVITHEAGHAFAGYVNRNRIPADTIWPSLEGCEVHSMSMEFFAEPWAEGFFGADAKKFLYTHLSESLCFIPYGTMVDHFQHMVYEYPEYTPEERHGVWKELLGIYMPWVKLGEIPFYGEAKGWQRQSHIYKTPFYYIDYCLAQTVALSFWAMIRKDLPSAFRKYLDYTKLGGSMVFTDLLKAAELDSPFEESCLRSICAEADLWLERYDLSGLE
ncbi:MAG: M3 family oligoendopeptidase [Oscillospiraceae bacterium]|nr:M3 family oligoendopeptidase [Oscillospiraceae bacterium]